MARILHVVDKLDDDSGPFIIGYNVDTGQSVAYLVNLVNVAGQLACPLDELTVVGYSQISGVIVRRRDESTSPALETYMSITHGSSPTDASPAVITNSVIIQNYDVASTIVTFPDGDYVVTTGVPSSTGYYNAFYRVTAGVAQGPMYWQPTLAPFTFFGYRELGKNGSSVFTANGSVSPSNDYRATVPFSFTTGGVLASDPSAASTVNPPASYFVRYAYLAGLSVGSEGYAGGISVVVFGVTGTRPDALVTSYGNTSFGSTVVNQYTERNSWNSSTKAFSVLAPMTAVAFIVDAADVVDDLFPGRSLASNGLIYSYEGELPNSFSPANPPFWTNYSNTVES